MLAEPFVLDAEAEASGGAVVRVGQARFTVLTERLIRLEYAPDGVFEDRPSQTFWVRRQPVPPFEARPEGQGVVIETAAFRLVYTGGPFTAESLTIRIKALDHDWRPGDVDGENLKGTTRTLDFVNGATPLTDGLISRAGWALLDDSQTFVLNEQGQLEPHAGNGADWYFLAYGHDYKAALQDYCAVSGPAPLIPRWILGNWWSRFWHFTQSELLGLMDEFERREIPLSVCIIDMDWHLTETGNASTGWTGYTWNKALYPDPQALIDTLHAKGLRTSLNLHPAEGIHNHEAQYPEMARRMGIDPASGEPVPFDITDPTFVRAYFEVLHHPYEAMGIDFWWLDWQQGQTCRIPNLDPLWLINHLHFQDSGRDPAKRPFIFSRWGSYGHQRYPIGFSGDSIRSWETLRFQPYMTATASNVAYGWWSHDIGGHTSGDGDNELYVRWVQFGVLSPIMRLHATKGVFYDPCPWAFTNADELAAVREAMQFRHALIPYLYTMAWRAHTGSLPLLLPMYYEYPEAEDAYRCPQQYLFGSELIAAPFTEPADPHTGLSRQVVWLPEGDWTNLFTGEHFSGGWHAVYGTLRDIPLFAKAGAIVPLGPSVGWGGVANPGELHVHVFAGADGEFTLVEDDGDSREYQNGRFARTKIMQEWRGGSLDLTVAPAEGDGSVLPAARRFVFHVHGVGPAQITRDGAASDAPVSYDMSSETLVIGPLECASGSGLRLRLTATGEALLSRRERKHETLLKLLQHFRLITSVRNELAGKAEALISNPGELAPYIVTMRDSQVRALCEVLYEAGVHHVPDTHHPDLVLCWNNRADPAITLDYSEAHLYWGMVRGLRHVNGPAPRFAAFMPALIPASHGAPARRPEWRARMSYHQTAAVEVGERQPVP